ncbi:AAA family ATPase, partial [Cytobacillus praedii]
KQQDLNLVTRYYLPFEVNLSIEKIGLIKYSETDSIYAYWTNDCSAKRYFIVDEEVVIILILNTNKKQISIKYKDRQEIKTEFNFVYEDWTLDIYHSKETEQKSHDFVFGNNSSETEIGYNNLTFSLLFLRDYRGMREQLVDFDHKFTYNKAKNELTSSIVQSVIPHFYGKNVHSLSCIVGKNGTGKTSTVDFLRGTFFRLLHLISENRIACESGYVSETDYEVFGILEKSCKFFVVFYIGSQPYYLTNIDYVTVSIVTPFNHSAYKSVNELSKVVYFSNMLSVSQDNLYTDEEMQSRSESTENNIAKSLISFRQADYSEEASFIQKRKGIEAVKQNDNSITVVNKELCYQLVFLEYLTQEKLVSYFDMPEDKVFILKSAFLGIEPESFMVSHSLKDMIVGKSRTLKKFLTAPDAKLDYFSSGQYAKFSFLAKLYWFLEGYNEYIQDFETLLGRNVFSRDEAILEKETALIFIDEGELYYHPEWQRSYIKSLVDLINDTNKDSKLQLQVVITTNSPFIISDILSEDITYLSKEEKNFERTFGQNIHKLLRDNFFMSYTIGEYSREVIENIMKWLNCDKDKDKVGEELSRYYGEVIEPKDYYDKIRCLIEKIGEPIYRGKLLEMLSESKFVKSSELKAHLLRQKAEIERKLKELQEG